jgi:hypothetical protein
MDLGLAPREHQHVQSRCNQPQRLKSALAIVFPRVLDNTLSHSNAAARLNEIPRVATLRAFFGAGLILRPGRHRINCLHRNSLVVDRILKRLSNGWRNTPPGVPAGIHPCEPRSMPRSAAMQVGVAVETWLTFFRK